VKDFSGSGWGGLHILHIQRNVVYFTDCYSDARKQAADETGEPLAVFSPESPYSPGQALDEEFLPV
jgi:hypothetical protein